MTITFLGAGDRAEVTAGQRPRPLSEPAHTITGKQTAGFRTPDGWRGATVAELALLQSYPIHIERPETMTDLVALDLFAGTGWGVACQRLGIDEYGVENMPEAIATRKLNGMETLFADVWDGLMGSGGNYPFLALQAIDSLRYSLLIASPPCQTFSMAGKGAGRAALDEVLEAIAERAYLDPAALKAFGEKHDDKTALVLTPLAYIARDLPRIVVLEQVPTVLPVWEAYAEVMRGWGYSVKVAVLNAEQYGVPQTRKRAILVARWDAEAHLPTPTHSRYYPTDPTRLDPGVKPWVSMAEALGWTDTDATIERHRGAGMLERHGERKGRPVAEPALTVTGNASGTTPGGFRVMRSNYGTGGDPEKRGEGGSRQPAPTMTSKADRNKWVQERPAPTVVGTRRSEGGMLIGRQLNDDSRRDVGGHSGTKGLQPGQLAAERVTAEEAAALQSYPEGFTFSGAKGKQFLQIGNAVPPLLAEAILKAATA